METKPAERTVSKFINRFFIVLVVVTNTIGNILLGVGMERMPDFYLVPFLSYLAILFTNWYVVSGTFLLAVWMFGQLSMFTWADLTYVLPVTSSSYVLTAILSKFFLGEKISVLRWLGIVIISFGVMLVSETPPDTKHEENTAA
jgi:uncharacterized membrane protein